MAAHIFHLGGALIVVTSVICMGEIVRVGRYFNVLLGVGLAAAPWFINSGTLGLKITGLVLGIFTAALAIPRGQILEKYGLWDKYVK